MNKSHLRGLILVGHGGVPKDYPRKDLTRLKTLEGDRIRSQKGPGPEEIELDRQIRHWPRTPQSDPYQAGLEALASQLRPLLDGSPLLIAYNEFCQPTLEEAARELINKGRNKIVVIPSMLTPGGVHSEIEIPSSIKTLELAYSEVEFRYLWPFDMKQIAMLFASQLSQLKP